VYHLAGIELLLKIVPIDNVLFASEMVGAVKGIDPETGHYFDDTKRYIDQVAWLSDTDRKKLYEDNARRVYPRMNARLKPRAPADPKEREALATQEREALAEREHRSARL